MNIEIMWRSNGRLHSAGGGGVHAAPRWSLCCMTATTQDAWHLLVCHGADRQRRRYTVFSVPQGAYGHVRARRTGVPLDLAWIVMSLFGCLPFWLSRSEIPSFVDALFEIGVAALPRRARRYSNDVEAHGAVACCTGAALRHWVGGMGVLVFTLAVLSEQQARIAGYTMHLTARRKPRAQRGASWYPAHCARPRSILYAHVHGA